MVRGINEKSQYPYGGGVSQRQEIWGNNGEIMTKNFPELRKDEQ